MFAHGELRERIKINPNVPKFGGKLESPRRMFKV